MPVVRGWFVGLIQLDQPHERIYQRSIYQRSIYQRSIYQPGIYQPGIYQRSIYQPSTSQYRLFFQSSPDKIILHGKQAERYPKIRTEPFSGNPLPKHPGDWSARP